MATPKFNSKSPTIRRILREAAEIANAPSPDYTAEPLESDLFEWHFTLRGPPNSVYSEGLYHGRIILPTTYPLRPPSFRFMTPSGRFEANREICLSISIHHEETWHPAWGVRTALVALRSFMETDARGQLGGLETTDAVRRRLAGESRNFKCAACGKTNQEIIKDSEERAQAAAGSSEEVEIPKELKMGWKDEMEARNKESGTDATANDAAESAQLAEGFVQTVPDSSSPVPAAVAETTSGSGSGSGSAPVPTTIGAGTATSTTVHHRVVSASAGQPLRQRRASDEGVPAWIDRTIVVLVVLLFALLLKILFAP